MTFHLRYIVLAAFYVLGIFVHRISFDWPSFVQFQRAVIKIYFGFYSLFLLPFCYVFFVFIIASPTSAVYMNCIFGSKPFARFLQISAVIAARVVCLIVNLQRKERMDIKKLILYR